MRETAIFADSASRGDPGMPSAGPRLSVRRRLALIVAASVVLWGGILSIAGAVIG